MNRAAADDASSDVAVAGLSASESRVSARDSDMLYRRPPARPIVPEPSGPWIGSDSEMSAGALPESESMGSDQLRRAAGQRRTDAPQNGDRRKRATGEHRPAGRRDRTGMTGEQRTVDPAGAERRAIDPQSAVNRGWATGERGALGTPAAPDFGTAGSSGSSRVSFGFSAGPISPNRQANAPVSPAWPQPTARDEVNAPAEVDAQGALAQDEWDVRNDFDVRKDFDARRKDALGEVGAQGEFAGPAGLDVPAPGQVDATQINATQVNADQFNAAAEFVGPAPFIPAPFTPAPFAPATQYNSAAEFNASFPATDVAAEAASWPQPVRPDVVNLEWVPMGASAAVDDRGERWTVDNRQMPAVRNTGGIGDEGGAGARRVAGREPPRAAPAGPPKPRQSRVVTAGIAALSVVVLLAGTVVGVAYFSGSDDKLDSVLQLGAGDTTGQAVTAPLDNRRKASFELLSGAKVVNLSIADLGADLYRISTPRNAGIRPSPAVRNDEVKLQVTPDGNGTGAEIDVVLAAKVNWSLRFSGYVEEQNINLTGGQVSGIEMVAGTRRAELALSRPNGTVLLKINGAIDDLILKSPVGSPVRVRVDGGAKTVVAGSRTLRDVPAGSTVTPKNWATQDRYDVAAGARITSLTVESA